MYLSVALPGHAEAIHWHGLPQRRTPYYDGVPWVTQCPVHFATTFRYEFLAEPGGTYLWHSHSGAGDRSYKHFGGNPDIVL